MEQHGYQQQQQYIIQHKVQQTVILNVIQIIHGIQQYHNVKQIRNHYKRVHENQLIHNIIQQII